MAEREEKKRNVSQAVQDFIEVFDDGKIKPHEIPIMLDSLHTVVGRVSEFMALFGIQKEIVVYASMAQAVLEQLSSAFKQHADTASETWTIIEAVLEDDQVEWSEVPQVIEALGRFMYIGLDVVCPFLDVATQEKLKALNSRIETYMNMFEGWIN